MPRRTREQLRRSEAAKLGWKRHWAREKAATRAAAAEFKRRSAASIKGWETIRAREREEWKIPETGEWIVEEPIDEVGGKYYE